MKRVLLAGTILAAVSSPALADNVALFLWNGLATDNGAATGTITLSSSSLNGIDITTSKGIRVTGPNGLGEANFGVTNTTNTVETLNILVGANGFSPNAGEFKLTGTIFNLVGSSDMVASYYVDSTNSLNGLTEAITGTGINGFDSGLLSGVDSFSFNGKGFDSVGAPYGLAERLTITLQPGAQIAVDGVGMTSVPEPNQWVMLLSGFGLMAALGVKRRKDRLASI